MNNVKLGQKEIGDGNPCYFIAEIGGLFKNFDEAKKLIDSAKEIGVDAVKFQTLEASTITTKKNLFDMDVTGNVSQYDFFKEFEPEKGLQKKVVEYANQSGIPVFSAPSHIEDLKLMEEMNLPIYKIGSDLACHIPLLKKIAKLDKPIILSTGMCSMNEVSESVNVILNEGNKNLILLHCVSDYPAKNEESNLNVINTLKNEFKIPVGFSDHTEGILTSLASGIMGANVIERHFRDPTNSPAPDDIHALTKEEFSKLIISVRQAEQAMGSGIKTPTISEEKNLLSNRVSIIVMQDISIGTKITPEMIDIRRPGIGLAPKFFDQIVGKTTKVSIEKETPLSWEMIE